MGRVDGNPWAFSCRLMAIMVVICVTAGQLDPNICQDVTNDVANANKRPQLPQQFRLEVECKMPEVNGTVFVKEYYDLTRNRGRISTKLNGVETNYYMDYDQNSVLKILPDQSSCQTGMLILSEDRFIFGYKTVDGNSQIYSPSGALHFSNVNEQYIGTNVIRGILVDEWHSCQYLPSINATAKVVWFFSRKDVWNMQLGMERAPVRMTAIGRMDNPLSHVVLPFNHTYDFFNFEPRVDSGDFTIPEGVWCKDRGILETPQPFPALPDTFYFYGEASNPDTSTFTIIQEAYDNQTNFAAFRFKLDTTTLTNMNRYTELNDYTTGVSYVIDGVSGSCSEGSIKQGIMSYPKSINSQQERLETPREFLMDSNINYQYAGSSLVRGIPCDRWVAQTNTSSGYIGTNVVVEWHFAAADQATWNTNAKYRIPVLFSRFLPGQDVTSPAYRFHIFNFNAQEALFNQIDTSQCFAGTEHKTLRFSISKTYETAMRTSTISSVVAIKIAMSITGVVELLRVTNVKLYFNPDKIWVFFDLLERPSYYDDVITNGKQNSLRQALDAITNAFKRKELLFVIPSPTSTPTQVKPDYLSFEDVSDVTSSSTGSGSSDSSSLYSTGALAGLGVAMLLVGGAGGSVGAYFFFK